MGKAFGEMRRTMDESGITFVMFRTQDHRRLGDADRCPLGEQTHRNGVVASSYGAAADGRGKGRHLLRGALR